LEYKFCALVFLRAQNKPYTFKLASNRDGYGVFGEVTLEYLVENSRTAHFFVQVKREPGQCVTMRQLLAEKGRFSLRKYYKSYEKIENKFTCIEEEVKLEGSIDESLFIVYTNADVEETLKSNNITDIGEEKFLMTEGSVLKFNEQDHPAIYEHLQGLPKHREFLRRFRIIYSQPNEEEIDGHIKSELQRDRELTESELDKTYMCFIKSMKKWWKRGDFFLKDTNSRENVFLRQTSEEVKPTLVTKMKFELD